MRWIAQTFVFMSPTHNVFYATSTHQWTLTPFSFQEPVQPGWGLDVLYFWPRNTWASRKILGFYNEMITCYSKPDSHYPDTSINELVSGRCRGTGDNLEMLQRHQRLAALHTPIGCAKWHVFAVWLPLRCSPPQSGGAGFVLRIVAGVMLAELNDSTVSPFWDISLTRNVLGHYYRLTLCTAASAVGGPAGHIPRAKRELGMGPVDPWCALARRTEGTREGQPSSYYTDFGRFVGGIGQNNNHQK